MIQMAPPSLPPRIALDDNDGLRRLRLGLWQWSWTMVTVLATAWVCTLGWIPGIIAIFTAKHVLVAILVMGLGVDSPRNLDGKLKFPVSDG
jgi:hypothetical protein